MPFPAWEALIVQVPAATSVTVVPVTVHLEVVVEEKPTASPDEDVALTVNGAVPNVLPANAAKVIVWFALAIVKLRSTSGAGAYVALPACEARIVHVPAATIVTVVPLTVHVGTVRLEKVTVRPEDAVADTVNGALPNVLLLNAANVIVCAVWACTPLASSKASNGRAKCVARVASCESPMAIRTRAVRQRTARRARSYPQRLASEGANPPPRDGQRP